MPNLEDLQLLLRFPSEKLSVEYKSWLDITDNPGKANLAKAAIALANEGGGVIVLGMREDEARGGARVGLASNVRFAPIKINPSTTHTPLQGGREQPRCITRRFFPDMSWATVQRENNLWHEAMTKLKSSPSRYKIPAPWLPTGHANGYSIVPLDSAKKLWKEGRAMDHCVASYDRKVAKGVC